MLEVLVAKLQFPVASALYALAFIVLVLLPVVEVADEIYLCSIRCPLAEHPSACLFVQAEIEMSCGKVAQCLLAVACQLIQLPHCMLVASTYCILKRFKPRVVLYKPYMLIGDLFEAAFLESFLAVAIIVML